MPIVFKHTLLLIPFLFISALHADSPKSLTFGFMPYLTAHELLHKYTPLADYLGQAVGIPVTLKITKNYADHVENAGKDQLDIAFMGGSSYIELVEKYGKKPLLVRYEIDGKPTFQSIIFTAPGSSLKKLEELAGKRFAFGDPSSTLSTQVPRYMLKKAEVPLEKLAGYDFLNNHKNVIFSVLSGNYDAGAITQEIFEENQSLNLKLLAESPPVSTHILVTRSDLEPTLIEKLQTALYQLKTSPQADKVLSAIGKNVTGFVPVTDQDYDLLRTMLKEIK